MSPSVDDALSQWLAQLAEMKAAIAELKTTQEISNSTPFGDDIQKELEVFDVRPRKGNVLDPVARQYYTYDESEEDTSSNDVADTPDDISGGAYDEDWLQQQCQRVEKQGSGLDGNQLFDQISATLVSTSRDEDLQMILVDVLGFEELELITDLIGHRSEIRTSLQQTKKNEKGGDFLAKLRTREEREEDLQRRDWEHKNATLLQRSSRESPKYPHVYKVHDSGNTLSATGKKYALPQGSQRHDYEKYEEYSIPPAKVGALAQSQRLIPIHDMDWLCKGTFIGYKTLNRMQSLLYPVAYKTSENMLVCAPTGAGKTDAAMLTILNTVLKHITVKTEGEIPADFDFTLGRENFKIVYVAPMKALAAEVVAKLAKRLSWLGIRVRELTGDMHLTKAEIIQTQIIVTTPEKWDVVTRKSTGDTELVQKVRLLIIDEVHMLHDERGAVLESLVARTERQVESTQSLIRIVGLSATLPNYIDVADFLKVNRMAGLFFFDQSFRPVPLEQHFAGVKGNPGSKRSKDNLEIVAFEKVRAMLERDHQVMVFVHSRKDTLKTARTLYQMAMDQQCTDLFDPTRHPRYDSAILDMKQSKGRELRELLPKGFGIHHAGMPRTDRNLVEKYFGEGVLKILCCTATLAWGVNLPAAAVVIKGTQVYSAQDGKFVDLGILDVLQIFGRAGRPQFQDTGIGFILTTHNKLHHYLSAVTQQQPIESRFSKKLVDNLNAEIALGTVTSVAEGMQWLGYSYLFVRMQRSPLSYGIDWAEIRDDPQLGQRRRKLIIDAARVLQQSQMIIFNESTEELRSKDVGRIASQYYILQTSIQVFNVMMRPRATEADILKMISMSGEFDNIQYRETESKELSQLQENAVPCQVGAHKDTPHAKTNILLQSYISRARVEDYTLVSDTAYVAQNATRICRALFMIALNRRWGYQCLVLLSLCKSVEKQLWPYQHPLYQYDLPNPVLRNLDEKGSVSSIESLRDMEPAEIGYLVHNGKYGPIISRMLDNFPTLTIEAEIAPLNRDILRIHLNIYPDFRWNERQHGTSESYWIWVEDSETSEIYHHEYFLLTRKKLHDEHKMDFTIPLSDPLPSQIYIRAVSDRWIGAETVTPVSFQHLIRPDTESVFTDLLNLQPLPLSALKSPLLEEIYGQRFQYFNPMQTQIFHCLYHTSENVLLGSPTGSGKTVAAELAMWWMLRENPGKKVVYIAPMKALVRERVVDWSKRLMEPMGLKLVELTGDNTPDTRSIRDADVVITTPEKWDGISRSWQTRSYVREVGLVVIDEIHLLGGDRGPILEIIVSRMNYIASQTKGSVRIVGMSTACANARDLANWLGVKQGLFNFRHSVRPVPLEIYIDGFPDQRGFCPFMQSMNRPTFLAVKAHSPEKPVIVFVPSRRQTRLTARDLINFCGMEDNPRRFVHMSEDDLAVNLSRVKDEALREALSFGIGLHHAGLVESDRQLAEELFANNKIQILIATSTLAWGVNLPAHLVVVKGTQFYDAKIGGYKDMDLTDVLQMLGRAGRPQFDTYGIARILTQSSKKAFYKNFLHTGFPVESSLHKVLDNHIGAEVSAETIVSKQDALDYLTWTFFFRRVHKNPSYYGLDLSPEEHDGHEASALANKFMIDIVNDALNELEMSSCVKIHPDDYIDPTPFGKIMSYYYLAHRTVRHLLKNIEGNASFQAVLTWICLATEYDELPVRHNEDLINTELASLLPIKTSGLNLPMGDPHVKTFLLLQAHFSRINLPISDYVGDLNSVLDQSIRVLQASIDIIAEQGHLSTCKQMITLLQCVKSARWPEDPPLAIFPGVRTENSNNRPAENEAKALSLAKASLLSPVALESLSTKLGVSRSIQSRFVKAVRKLPDIRVQATEITALQITLFISRQHPIPDENRMYAPCFPKPQTEGFFVILVERGKDEIIALKRIGWPQIENQISARKPKLRTTLTIPQSDDERRMDVVVMSDGYIGMEWRVDGLDIPRAPIVDVENDKKEKS